MSESERCPACGNVIQPFMNGVCGNCARNQRERAQYRQPRSPAKRRERGNLINSSSTKTPGKPATRHQKTRPVNKPRRQPAKLKHKPAARDVAKRREQRRAPKRLTRPATRQVRPEKRQQPEPPTVNIPKPEAPRILFLLQHDGGYLTPRVLAERSGLYTAEQVGAVCRTLFAAGLAFEQRMRSGNCYYTITTRGETWLRDHGLE